MARHRSLFVLIVIAGAIAAGLLVSSRHSAFAQRGAEAAAWAGQKWDYKVVSWDHRDINDVEKKWPGEILNEQGQEGWELIAIHSSYAAPTGTMYFKRPIMK